MAAASSRACSRTATPSPANGSSSTVPAAPATPWRSRWRAPWWARSRSPTAPRRARVDLARRVAAAYPHCRVEVGPKDARGYDIAANATSVGLGEDELSFDVSQLDASTLVTEVIMKPDKTALIRAAEARGCPVQQGKYMLDYQMDLIFDFMRLGQGAR